MVTLPRDATGRRHAFFDEEGLDQLLSMVLELATELWTVRERLYVLEAAATTHGLPLRDYVENHVLMAQEQSELASMRTRMLNEIFRTLGRDHRPAHRAAEDIAQDG